MPDASVDSTHWMIGCTWLTCHWPNFGGRRRRRVRPDCQATNQGYRAYCNDLQEWLPSRRVSANVVFCDPFYNAADGLFLSYHHRRSTKRAARLWAECMVHSPAGGHVGFPLLFCFGTSGLVHTRAFRRPATSCCTVEEHPLDCSRAACYLSAVNMRQFLAMWETVLSPKKRRHLHTFADWCERRYGGPDVHTNLDGCRTNRFFHSIAFRSSHKSCTQSVLYASAYVVCVAGLGSGG
jgi:hypothetical protein